MIPLALLLATPSLARAPYGVTKAGGPVARITLANAHGARVAS